MRIFTGALLGIVLALPLAAANSPARADTDNLPGQVQRFFNGNSQNSDRDAYERGREDEMRRREAERDRHEQARRDELRREHLREEQRDYRDRDDYRRN